MKLDLNQAWLMRSENLNCGPEMAPAVLRREDNWLACHVPCDIHMPLIEHGIIEEPLTKLNSLDSEWTEGKSWWFKKTFEVSSTWLEKDIIELTFETLDSEADIFLNGFHIGRQRSSYYAFTKDVKQWLLLGNNDLLVRVTAGTEYFSASDASPVRRHFKESGLNRGDFRLPLVRKPVYVYGFDWAPRVVTCGILDDVYLTGYSQAVIRSAYASTKHISEDFSFAELTLTVELENLNPLSTMEGKVLVDVLWEGGAVYRVEQEVLICSGLNYVDAHINLDNPHLWWPHEMGKPDLYEVHVSLIAGQQHIQHPSFQTGVRIITINQQKLNANERLFAIEVNGIRMFSKGGNWVPPDSIHARVTDDKYRGLLLEAKNANFNMLRIWGGGIYERNKFYELCDEYGLLVWQDSMFACNLYPDHLDWFRAEVENELNYQTRRLRNHPCIAIWTGNNENQWLFEDYEVIGGLQIYNQITPRIIRNNCPHIPYWNSSPYGGVKPNGDEVGDSHQWHELMMHKEMERRITPEEYDKVNSKFVSEFGYPGAPRKSTIEHYHDGESIDPMGKIWALHNNTYEKDTVLAGISKHYVESDDLTLDQYIHYSGLCQGLMLGYALESLRFKTDCSGGLIWMYTDTWGEIGWTIVDYYLKRKVSYNFVRRAFQPHKFIIRQQEDKYLVVGINETADLHSLEVEYGYTSFDGQTRHTQYKIVDLEPCSRQVVLEWDIRDDCDLTLGCYFVKPKEDNQRIIPAIYRSGVFRDLAVSQPIITIDGFRLENNTAWFQVSSTVYVHAVHFNLDESLKLSDEYFDLLPGEVRTVTIDHVPNDFTLSKLVPQSVNN